MTTNMPFFWIDYAINASSNFCKTDLLELAQYGGSYEEIDISLLNYETQTFYRQICDRAFYGTDWGFLIKLYVGFTSDVICLKAEFSWSERNLEVAETTWYMKYKPCTDGLQVNVMVT